MHPKFDKIYNYYVYVWFNEDNFPVYVGSGKNKRWQWRKRTEDQGHKCRIIYHCCSEPKARAYEKQLISYLTEEGYKLENKILYYSANISKEIKAAYKAVEDTLPKYIRYRLQQSAERLSINVAMDDDATMDSILSFYKQAALL